MPTPEELARKNKDRLLSRWGWYSMLRSEEIDPEIDERSAYDLRESLWKQPPSVVYNPNVPIDTSDFIISDECHRSIYNLWRQVLEYFDAYLIGLTATPSKQTIGFLNKDFIMEYGHECAVADEVNVNYDVYKIETEITKGGSHVEKGLYVDKRDRLTADCGGNCTSSRELMVTPKA